MSSTPNLAYEYVSTKAEISEVLGVPPRVANKLEANCTPITVIGLPRRPGSCRRGGDYGKNLY